jgi:hypothetical protein
MGQQEFRIGPALVFVTDQVLRGHLHVVEPDLVDFMFAVQHGDGPQRNTGRFHVDQEKRNTLLRSSFGTGAHQAKYPVGVLTESVPGFLAVDEIAVALTHSAGSQACEIGAGARLGISLAPPIFARNDSRQEIFLLCGVGECHQHRRQHSH